MNTNFTKAYFIDFDRTLVESLDTERHALEQAYKSLGITYTIEFEHKNSLRELIAEINKRYNLPFDFETVEEEFIKAALKIYKDAPLKEGVHEFFDWARKKGKKIFIITLNEREFVESVLTRYNLQVDGIYTKRETGIHKREGELYLYAFSHAGFLPSECVVIEDYPYYVMSIKDSGAQIVGMFDYQGQEELKELERISKKIITNYKELIE